MIEMNVHARHDMSLKLVLDMRELSGEIAYMMVVNEGDRRHHLTTGIAAPFLTHQLIANQIAKRFRPRGIFAATDDVVELSEEVVIQRDAESNELLHSDATIIRFVLRSIAAGAQRVNFGVAEEVVLFPPYGDVENGPLTVDEEQCEITGFHGVGEALKRGKIRNRLTI